MEEFAVYFAEEKGGIKAEIKADKVSLPKGIRPKISRETSLVEPTDIKEMIHTHSMSETQNVSKLKTHTFFIDNQHIFSTILGKIYTHHKHKTMDSVDTKQ